jgi:hypothetical protein
MPTVGKFATSIRYHFKKSSIFRFLRTSFQLRKMDEMIIKNVGYKQLKQTVGLRKKKVQ